MEFSCGTYLILLLITGLTDPTICSIQSVQNKFDLSKLQNIFRGLETSSFTDGTADKNISNPCFRDYFHFLMDLKNLEPWTLKMIDASSKIPNGILTGNIFDLGMFDECVAIMENRYGRTIRGKHCIYALEVNIFDVTSVDKEFIPKLSICVPSSCNDQDVTHMLRLVFFNITNISNLGLSNVTATCSGVEPPEWTTLDIVVSMLLGVYLLFLSSCTIFDILQIKMKLKNRVIESLSKFSMRKSALQILNLKIKPGSFPVINGIRALSIIWIVLGHEYLSRVNTVLHVNNLRIRDWLSSWNALYIFIAPFAVDTFFTMSGFLLSYLFIKEMSTGKKFNILGYYLHRYIRLTPAVIALLTLSIFISPHLGWGPIWEKSVNDFLCEKCKEMWWAYLLYVRNFFKKENPCLKHLWYLAVEMQLFLISPIILYPLAKKPKLGYFIFGICFVISIISPALVIAINEYPVAQMEGAIRGPKTEDMFDYLFAVPHTRAAAWLIGIISGYLVATKPIKMNMIQVFFGWITAVLCFLFCTLSFRNLQSPDHQYDVVWESFLGAVCRPIWATGVSWIIVASIGGVGGPMTQFLSLPIFSPISKISYSIYLLHMVIQNLRVSAFRTTIYFSDFQVFTSFLSSLVITIVASFIFSLFFESPMLVLEKIVFRRENKIDKTEETNLSNKVKENGVNIISKNDELIRKLMNSVKRELLEKSSRIVES